MMNRLFRNGKDKEMPVKFHVFSTGLNSLFFISIYVLLRSQAFTQATRKLCFARKDLFNIFI